MCLYFWVVYETIPRFSPFQDVRIGSSCMSIVREEQTNRPQVYTSFCYVGRGIFGGAPIQRFSFIPPDLLGIFVVTPAGYSEEEQAARA